MKLNHSLFWCTCIIGLSYLATPNRIQAQITPDSTTSTQASQSENTFTITGGKEAGVNLFHSFTDFSVPEGKIASFVNNNEAIRNVINRITGSSKSEINGAIEASGLAPNFNLFIINPNGISFGSNSSLKLNGSFVGTTANAIGFGDRGFFSASEPNDPSLLTVNPSAFLFNKIPASSIIYQSKKALLPNSQSFLLLGGEVILDGATLTIPDGRIELGGLAGTGTVDLNIKDNNLSLNFPHNQVRANILLTNQTKIDVSDRGVGSIGINAQNVEISGGSQLLSDIKANQPGNRQSGEININATGIVTIKDVINNNTIPIPSLIRSLVFFGAFGDASNILIKAGSLSILNGGAISSISAGQGNSGNISIDVNGNISLKGDNSSINTRLASKEKGTGGDISIEAKSVSLEDGAFFQATTSGIGDAGNIFIKVDDFISLVDNQEIANNQTTQIRTVVEAGAVGNGGIIDIQARSFSLSNGSALAASVASSNTPNSSGGKGKGGEIVVNASDFVNITGLGTNGFPSVLASTIGVGAEGQAGNITVNTGNFRLADGAVVSAETFNASNGGNVTINATNFEAANGAEVKTASSSSGDAGRIEINTTENFALSGNETKISVNSEGSGLAGNLEVIAGSVQLRGGGELVAESSSGNGGNIRLKIADNLLMSNGSKISTNAGTEETLGDGGNISIDLADGVLFAVPPDATTEDSNITANAFEGSGGQIDIKALGIIGIAQQAEDIDGRNDITASSEFGEAGSINIDTTRVDLNKVPAPIAPITTEVAQVCQIDRDKAQSQFILTGRGGLPPNPKEVLSNDAVQVDWVSLNRNSENAPVSVTISDRPKNLKNILEATGWAITPQGKVILVADAANSGNGNFSSSLNNCKK